MLPANDLRTAGLEREQSLTHRLGSSGFDALERPLRILYLCSRQIYSRKMSRGRFHAVAALTNSCQLRITGNGWEDYHEDETVAENVRRLYHGDFPDAVLAYKPLDHVRFSDLPCLKLITYNEMWDVEGTTREIVESGARLVIAHHRNDIEKYGHLRDVRFVNISHCAETSIYRDYGLSKDIDLLLAGAMDEYHYPFRARLKRLMEGHLSQRLRCRVLPHPGFDLQDLDGVILEDYARMINRSKITLTCSSRWKYRLAKYVEVPMCASLLAADLPDEDHDFFRRFMLVIDPEATDEEIIDRLIFYAVADDARDRLIQTGRKLCADYSQENYAARLIRAIHACLDRDPRHPPADAAADRIKWANEICV
jgi:hypothetical protein